MDRRYINNIKPGNIYELAKAHENHDSRRTGYAVRIVRSAKMYEVYDYMEKVDPAYRCPVSFNQFYVVQDVNQGIHSGIIHYSRLLGDGADKPTTCQRHRTIIEASFLIQDLKFPCVIEEPEKDLVTPQL